MVSGAYTVTKVLLQVAFTMLGLLGHLNVGENYYKDNWIALPAVTRLSAPSKLCMEREHRKNSGTSWDSNPEY